MAGGEDETNSFPGVRVAAFKVGVESQGRAANDALEKLAFLCVTNSGAATLARPLRLSNAHARLPSTAGSSASSSSQRKTSPLRSISRTRSATSSSPTRSRRRTRRTSGCAASGRSAATPRWGWCAPSSSPRLPATPLLLTCHVAGARRADALQVVARHGSVGREPHQGGRGLALVRAPPARISPPPRAHILTQPRGPGNPSMPPPKL